MNELPASYDRWRANPPEYVDRPDEEPSAFDGPMTFAQWLEAERPEGAEPDPYGGAPCDWCRVPIQRGAPHATFVGPETLTMHRGCALEWMDQ